METPLEKKERQKADYMATLNRNKEGMVQKAKQKKVAEDIKMYSDKFDKNKKHLEETKRRLEMIKQEGLLEESNRAARAEEERQKKLQEDRAQEARIASVRALQMKEDTLDSQEAKERQRAVMEAIGHSQVVHQQWEACSPPEGSSWNSIQKHLMEEPSVLSLFNFTPDYFPRGAMLP